PAARRGPACVMCWVGCERSQGCIRQADGRADSVWAMTRRAKIVCTLGPVTSSLEQITALVEAGMDVARLNFSHGAHEDHAAAYAVVRQASDRTGRAVAVLADLQGPKIRLGTFTDGPVV